MNPSDKGKGEKKKKSNKACGHELKSRMNYEEALLDFEFSRRKW